MNHLRLLLLLCIASMYGMMKPLMMVGQTAEKFDGKVGARDGLLSGAEITAYILHMKNLPFDKLDGNKNGVIDDAELAAATENELTDLYNEYGKSSGYTYEEMERLFGSQPQEDLCGILIRDSYEDVTIADGPKGFAKAKAGMVAFERDILTNTNTFSVKAAIMYPFRLDSPSPDSQRNDPYISAMGIIPSVTLNRVTNANPDKDLNSLQFRLGFDVEMFRRFVDLQNIRAYCTWATDFDFNSSVVAAEIGWLPTHLNLGLGSFKTPFGTWFGVRWLVYPYTEFGHVVDAGDKANLTAGDKFFRLGGKLALDVQLFGSNQLTLGGVCRYLYGFKSRPQDIRLYELTASYGFGLNGHASLEAKYTTGSVPLTLEKTDAVSVGVGIKF